MLWVPAWMLSVFVANLSFEDSGGETEGWGKSEDDLQSEARLRAAESLGYEVTRDVETQKENADTRPQEYDNWLLEKKVKIRNDLGEEDVGDSCCFGTRTVDMGMDCIRILHGGI